MKLRITIEGVSYEVEVEVLEENGGPTAPPAPRPVSAPPKQPPTAPVEPPKAQAPVVGGSNQVCKSPLAGVVLAVHVKPGDTVQQNQVIALLEAMKMETKIASPMAGKVKAVHASAGDTVKSGQVLVEFE